MNLKDYYFTWPQVTELFPVHYQLNTLPASYEVEATITELYRRGNFLTAARLTDWWYSLPESLRFPEAHMRLYPPPSTRTEAIAQGLESRASQPNSIRFKDIAMPLVVMISVVVFMVSSVLFSNSKAPEFTSPNNFQTEPLPQGPVEIAPPATIPDQPISARDHAPSSNSEYFENIRVYRISDDLILDPNPTAAVASLWHRAIAIFGEDAKKLDSLGVAYDENANNIAAYIDLNERELVINLNQTMMNPEVQTFTLLHEYNHLVSLLDEYTLDGNSCSTVLLLAGTACLKEDSSLYRWILQFWDEPGMLKNTETGNMEAGEELFAERPGEFVSVYAASAPQEDMAESFATWVLGYEMPAAKAKFFEKDAESVALRERILYSLNRI